MNLAEWLEHQQRQHPREIAMGLERVAAVAKALGLRKPAARVITVAGTNGKGSTVAFIEAIARASGAKVGAYTSPHLLRYNERVRIDGIDATDAQLIAAFERIEAARGDTPLTYFEYGTLAALLLFSEAGLDLAVLEVGLGGRLDAVNIVDADVAVITTVAIDHAELLGADRETIALEKAGIVRAGKPAVVGELDPPDNLLRQIDRVGAFAIRAGKQYRFGDRLGGKWFWQDDTLKLELKKPGLIAPAQTANAAAAIAALRAVVPALPLTEDHIASGVAAATVPGRMQRIGGPIDIVLDVAHNPQAAQQLARWLMTHRAAGATQAVFAALSDKDIPNLVGALMGQVDVWRLAGLPDAGGRAQDVDTLSRKVSGLLSRTPSSRHATVAEALDAARRHAHAGDRIIVFGSFHTVAQALHALNAMPA
ncbi:bifunctional tetrahydrofolate synthase/dihydrofolate synthase [Chiayiivirga flava]|uniref:Dihydrofolate synthase/folylpolyglutamate synthase n=1 Tax=Chiayiivirga flava TaxID=659595 RepID=A0A7W8G159_9GAMM|nr:bifunctional tetrahydrofolate synthase/dihydrofolate synthase [Chiayiivirga flava]MBB5207335.1 dihydrofolate synthase/folylpolyglutamate synthase [Chiayiivirga flava]